MADKLAKEKEEERLYYQDNLQIKWLKSGLEYEETLGVNLNEPFYPTDAILSYFAEIVYNEQIKTGNIAPILKDYGLDDWILHSWAENTEDEYFGAVFYNKRNRQIVLAHRGTVRKKRESLYTDIQGVMGNQLTSQIHSATTYCALALERIDQNKVRVSFTGHSLGAWLAQITTFTSEYLRLDEAKKFKAKVRNPNYLIHAVVLDSPGCYEMLSLLSNIYYQKMGDEADDMISSLDITIYFNMPNVINSCNSHNRKSRLLQIFEVNEKPFDLSKKNMKTHKKKLFVDMFKSGKYKKLIVVNWPSIRFAEETEKKTRVGRVRLRDVIPKLPKILLDAINMFGVQSNELDLSLKKLKECGNSKNYYEEMKKEGFVGKCKAVEYNEKIQILSIFTQKELNFLKIWEKFKNEGLMPNDLNEFLKGNFLPDFENFFPKFEIKENTKRIKCFEDGKMEETINFVKNLLSQKSEAYEIIKEDLAKKPTIYEAYYRSFSKTYVSKIPEYNIEFEDTIKLQEFLKSETENVFCISTQQKTVNEIFRIKKLLGVKCENKYCFLSLVELKELQEFIDTAYVFKNPDCQVDRFLTIDCGMENNAGNFSIVENLLEAAKNHKIEKKLILVVNKKISSWKVNKDTKTGFQFSDFTPETRRKLLQQGIATLKNVKINLSTYLGKERPHDFLSNPNVIKTLINQGFDIPELCSENVCNFENVKMRCLKIYENIEINRFKIFIEQIKDFEKKISIIISGGSVRDLKNLLKEIKNIEIFEFGYNNSADFYKFCYENPENKIYWLYLWKDSIEIQEVFDSEFYVDRYFYQRKLSETLTETKLERNEDRVVIIADEPGMGKSTTSLNIATKMNNTWIIWINLISVNTFIPEKINTENIVEFLQKSNKNLTDPLVASMLRYSLLRKSAVPLVLFFDGYDELDENARTKMIKIFEFIKKTNARLWITTRTYAKDPLESSLSTIVFKMRQIPEEIQLNLITNIWQSRLMSLKENQSQLTEIAKELLYQVEKVLVVDQKLPGHFQRIIKDQMDDYMKKLKTKNILKNCNLRSIILNYKDQTRTSSSLKLNLPKTEKFSPEMALFQEFLSWVCFFKWEDILYLQKYFNRNYDDSLISETLEILRKSCDDDDQMSSLIGIPMQLRMIADIAQPKIFSNEISPETLFKNFYNMYRKFISKRIKTYFNEKSREQKQNFKLYKKALIQKHESLGFQLLFSELTNGFLDADDIVDSINEKNKEEIGQLNDIGLAQLFDSNFLFVHYSFAEYCATKKILRLLMRIQKDWSNPKLEDFIESDILTNKKFKIIRKFLNDYVEDDPNIFSFLSKRENIPTIADGSDGPLDVAVEEKNDELGKVLLDSYKCLQKQNDDRVHRCLPPMLYDAVVHDNSLELIQKIIDLKPRQGFCEIENPKYPAYKEYAIYCRRGSLRAIVIIFLNSKKLVKIENDEQINELLLSGKLIFPAESNLKTFMEHVICELEAELFKKLMEDFPNECREVIGKWGNELLHLALLKCQEEEIVEDLLGLGANIDGVYNQETPLTAALSKKRIHMVDFLIDHGADVNIPNGNNVTAIQIAGENGHIEMISKLLDKGANIEDVEDMLKLTPIGISVLKNDCNQVRRLIEDPDTDVNVSIAEKPLLQVAVISNRPEIVNELLKKEEFKNKIDEFFIDDHFTPFVRYSPLGYAIRRRFEDLAKILRDNGANVKILEERVRLETLYA